MGRHAMGGTTNPVVVVLARDALLDRQPHDLLHGATLALSLAAQQRGLLVGEPECHGHAQHDTAVIPAVPAAWFLAGGGPAKLAADRAGRRLVGGVRGWLSGSLRWRGPGTPSDGAPGPRPTTSCGRSICRLWLRGTSRPSRTRPGGCPGQRSRSRSGSGPTRSTRRRASIRGRHGAAGRGDDLGGGGRAEPVLHRRDLLQRPLHLPGAGRPRPRRRMEQGGHGVVRVAAGGRPVSRALPAEPHRGGEPAWGLVGRGDRGQAGLGGADLQPAGRRPRLLRDRRDPPPHRQLRRRRGGLHPGARAGLRPAARPGPAPPGPGQGRGRPWRTRAGGCRQLGEPPAPRSAPGRAGRGGAGGRRPRRREDGAPALEAGAATARGALRLAEGEVPEAIEALRHACVTWRDLRLPYEAAQTRALYGLALRKAGHEEDARLELRAALAAFERLGAGADAAKAADLLAGPAALPGGLTVREVEVLHLVAAGRTNREVAAALTVSEHTVARHLQNIFAKLGVSSRAAATAFAVEHGLA